MATNNAINVATAASGTVLQGQGVATAPAFSTATYPATTTANQLLYSSATNTVGGLSTANNGLLVTSNSGVPSLLAGSGTTGQVLQSNAAAAPSFSTATYPATTTINQLLYSSAANTVGGLATANSGVLVTSGGGVPSISTTIPSGVALPANGGGSLVLIQSQAASNSATLDFTTNTNLYNTYFFTFTSVIPVSNAVNLEIQISQNSGGAWVTSSYKAGVNYTAYNATTVTNANSTAHYVLTGPATTDSSGINGYCYIYNANIGNNGYTTGIMNWQDNVLATSAIGIVGGNSSTGANAFRILFSSGNISSGTITLYGLKTS